MAPHMLSVLLTLSLAATTSPRLDPDPDAPARVAQLIADLASTKPWDVTYAMSYPSHGPNWRKALLATLESQNLQQRHAAAQVLREMPGVQATEKLIAVTVEGLRNDAFPGKEVNGVRLPIANAAGFRWLIKQQDAARGPLTQALESDDLQQRFLAAVCLAAGGDKDHTARIAQILLPHLRDNQIAGDALIAGCALYRLGNSAIPALNDAKRTADKQQREIIDLILFDLASPPRTDADFAKRRGMQTIWVDTYDPIAWFKPEELQIEWRGTITEARRDTPGPLIIRTNAEAEEQVGTFNSILVQVRGTVDTGRKNGVYLTGPGLNLWLAGIENEDSLKPGSTLTVQGTLEWYQWPDAEDADGNWKQTKTDSKGKGMRELVLQVVPK